VIAILFTLACAPKLPTETLTIGEQSVRAEIAATHEDRQMGLMHRDSLGTDAGMLFIYPDVKVRGFWMKDTRIPLSIAFADADGVIVRIADMKPFDESRTSSLYPAKYALEMEKGWFEAKGIEKGAKIAGIPDVKAE
jgi:uncharacterized protein